MKTRMGFVSNSSSSSFVIAGWRHKLTKAELKLLLEYYKIPEEDDYLLSDEKNFIQDDYYCGVRLGYAFDSEVIKITPEMIATGTKEASEIAKALGLPEPSIYAGTTYG